MLPCVASFVWDQSVCILTPLMDLGSCQDLITNYFPTGIPELAVAFILRDTLHGLDYIHQQGIILRSVFEQSMESGLVLTPKILPTGASELVIC